MSGTIRQLWRLLFVPRSARIIAAYKVFVKQIFKENNHTADVLAYVVDKKYSTIYPSFPVPKMLLRVGALNLPSLPGLRVH